MNKHCPLGRISCDTQKNPSFIGSDGIRRVETYDASKKL